MDNTAGFPLKGPRLSPEERLQREIVVRISSVCRENMETLVQTVAFSTEACVHKYGSSVGMWIVDD